MNIQEENPEKPQPGSWWRRAGAYLLILTVLYGNVAVLLSPLPVGMQLPLPRFLHEPFILFGVFNNYETVNKELVIWGLKENALDGDPNGWIRLETENFFPVKRGEQLTRAWVSHHAYTFGGEGQNKAWQQLTEKIRLRHNRLHPDQPVRKTAIYVETWPRGFRSYEQWKTPERTHRYGWFTEKTDRTERNWPRRQPPAKDLRPVSPKENEKLK